MHNQNISPRPASYIPDAAREVLSKPESALQDGKYNPDPLKSLVKAAGVPASILVDKNVALGQNESEIHRHEADLWIGIDGEARFQVGGVLKDAYIKKNADGTTNDLELKGSGIEGGEEYTIRAGDILYIPEGQPHVHWTGEGKTARLWIIKLPAKEHFPLEAIQDWRPE